MATQTRTRGNGNKNGRSTPDMIGALKRGPGRPRKIVAVPTRTAEQIAESLEAEAKRLQGVADILRGKA